jgi:hypothetical protein
MRTACGNALPLMTSAMQNAFGIKPEDTITLLDQKATYAEVKKALDKLSKDVEPKDMVIIFVNVHGGVIEGDYKGYGVYDEGLAFYTEDEPDNPLSAIRNKEWMLVKDFRDMVDEIEAGRVVVVFDACESGAAVHDFKNDPHSAPVDSAAEAVLISSHETQYANFNADGTMPLFTQVFAETLSAPESKGKTLFEVFHKARFDTHLRLTKDCEESPDLLKKIDNGEYTYDQVCGQMPYGYDPQGLLDEIVVGK